MNSKTSPERHPSADRFELPAEVTMSKRLTPHGTAYVFRHHVLGQLGRVVLKDRPTGGCNVTCEVAGDPADPMTARRLEIFEPIGLGIVRQLGGDAHPRLGASTPFRQRTPEPAGIAESKALLCDRCEAVVALLVFAPEAAGGGESGHLEDVARLMYPHYSELGVPTWIIGPAALNDIQSRPPEDVPSNVLQVWPIRGDLERLSSRQFNPRTQLLQRTHCS